MNGTQTINAKMSILPAVVFTEKGTIRCRCPAKPGVPPHKIQLIIVRPSNPISIITQIITMMLWRIFDWTKDQRRRPHGTPRQKQGRRRVSGRDHQGQARDLWEAPPLPDATLVQPPPPSSLSKTTTSERGGRCARQEKATGGTSTGTLETLMGTTTIPSSIHLAGNCFYFKGMKVRFCDDNATNE
jgi:hypothetical protein